MSNDQRSLNSRTGGSGAVPFVIWTSDFLWHSSLGPRHYPRGVSSGSHLVKRDQYAFNFGRRSGSPAGAAHGVNGRNRVDDKAEDNRGPHLPERVAGGDIEVQQQPKHERMIICRLLNRPRGDEPGRGETKNPERGDEPAEKIHPRRRIP